MATMTPVTPMLTSGEVDLGFLKLQKSYSSENLKLNCWVGIKLADTVEGLVLFIPGLRGKDVIRSLAERP